VGTVVDTAGKAVLQGVDFIEIAYYCLKKAGRRC
jgi:hypothetical protein